jgi:hypothetical protein
MNPISKTVQHKLSLCPWCGVKIAASTRIGDESVPKPGDLTVCLNCASPCRYDLDMTVLKSSDKEMRELLDDKEYFLYENCRRGILNLDRRNK